MTQAEIDGKLTRLQEITGEKEAALKRRESAYEAERAAHKHTLDCREAVWALGDERDDILDIIAVQLALIEANIEAKATATNAAITNAAATRTVDPPAAYRTKDAAGS